MDRKKIVWVLFVLVAFAQQYVPAKMILDREEVLSTGTEYKFETAPIDPSDPFRGKYITLRYAENTIQVKDDKNWTIGEPIYVSLEKDGNGFAKITAVTKERPNDGKDFFKAEVSYITGNGSNNLIIDYPFDRYYMEESKAYEAELSHRRAQQDTSQVTYALVNIKNGNAVLKDVLINGIPIREIVKKELQNKD